MKTSASPTRRGERFPVEIFLVRHAQPDWEPDGLAVDEPELTPLGHAQAACCAEALRDESFDAFYASPLRRVRDTVEPIAKHVAPEPVFHSGLRENELPPLEGQTTAQVEAFFEKVRSRSPEQWWDGSPGVEPFAHFRDRVCQGIEELLSRHHQIERFEEGRQRLWRVPREGPRLLIVAHEGTNAVLLAHLLGIHSVPWEWLRFSSSWAGITKLKSWHFPEGAIFTLDYFNQTQHLAELDAGGGRKP